MKSYILLTRELNKDNEDDDEKKEEEFQSHSEKPQVGTYTHIVVMIELYILYI